MVVNTSAVAAAKEDALKNNVRYEGWFSAATNADDFNLVKTFSMMSSGAKEAAANINASSGVIVKGLATIKGGVKGLWSSLSAFGKIWVAATALYGVYKLADYLAHTGERANAKMEDSASSYSNTKTEIESINSQLKTTQDRINELNTKGGLTIVEKGELDRLKETTLQLQIQKDLLEKEAEIKAKETAGSVTEALGKNFYNVPTSDEQVAAYKDLSDKYGWGRGNKAWDKSNVSGQLAYLKHLQEIQSGLDTGSKEWENYQGKIDDTTTNLWNCATALEKTETR